MHMKTAVIALLLLLAIALGAFLYVWYANRGGDEEGTEEPRIDFPLVAPSRPDLGGAAAGSFEITGRDGRSITVRNFIENSITIEDPSNDGIYYLAGSSGVCLEDGTCPTAGQEQGFSTVYFTNDQSFAIAIKEEPLGEKRLAVERFLMQTLGISEEDMCALRYVIGTSPYVNETYGAIDNLGFSFCPGAVKLP
jgi:hypothetical protein